MMQQHGEIRIKGDLQQSERQTRVCKKYLQICSKLAIPSTWCVGEADRVPALVRQEQCFPADLLPAFGREQIGADVALKLLMMPNCR